MPQALTVVVLAGGRSRRMGRDKALLPMGETLLLQRVIDAAAPLSSEHLLITNTPDSHTSFTWPIASDFYPNKGPLGGLYTALSHAKTTHILLLACDLPYLNTPFLRFLSEQIDECQAVVPDSGDGLQPLCAIYSRTILSTVTQSIKENNLGMRRLLANLDIRKLSPEQWKPFDPDGNLFTNLNTPEDYQRIQ
ncbi:MAG: molybdenum cofactor guanylyltransferase [Candidatus Latescibacterota bacterium]